MVEQRDAEQLHNLDPVDPFAATATQVTPTLTKSWFHTGVWRHQDTLLDAYATEYWDGDPAHPTLPRPRLPKGLPPATRAHAHRTLKGAPLREEVWADDPTATASPCPGSSARTPTGTPPRPPAQLSWHARGG